MALLDCLVYIVLLMVVLGMAYAGFYGVLDHTTRLSRNAADISRALKAGEQWRADVRAASAQPRRVESEGQMVFQILQGKSQITYFFKGDTIYRQAGPNAAPLPFLVQVKNSRMLLDLRQQVTSCRWELELDGGKTPNRLKPLFTFQAMPGKL